MNDQSTNSNELPLTGGAFLRAAADGELSPAEQARLEAHLAANPADKARISFETGLRSCCCRVMSSAKCPDALRNRILDQITSTDTVSPPAARARSFWATHGTRRWLGAIAAAVVLFVGVAFVMNLTRYGANVPSQAQFAQVVSYVAKEHRECDINPDRVRKFTIASIEDAPGALASIVGSEPTVPNLEAAGMVFKGAGRCRVPDGGQSAHLRFEMPDPDGGPPQRLSLFIQQRTALTPDLDENVAYLLTDKDGVSYGSVVYAWRKGDVLYYLVAKKLSACNKFRDAVGIPKTVAAR
ncbi:MAG: zf-HC2 domain-containing protein [Phycisphaeraceae bacterium]|nr:zf-HC2 domain-containing protein [Phycisphaeraceae bacterium]